MQTSTATYLCGYCGEEYAHRFGHHCRTSGLPRAKRREGDYALRLSRDFGWLLWVDIPDRKKNEELAGTSYVVGSLMDPDNFHAAVEEAEHEAQVLFAQTREEFGF